MNKLQFESSPYLKQHKDNPVDWNPWSKSTLDEARQLNKPILVSIGYSTCHWCHVMAHESFEDPETAKIMNRYFINIKIDREERPDLDHYFMNAIQAMGISGGWPLHCFLSPEGKPFFGGTYFPPEPKYGRPSWTQILLAIQQAFQNKSLEILDQADQLFNHLNQLNDLEKIKPSRDTELSPNEIFSTLQSSMDHEHGGFGSYPKFPNTQGIQLLFHLYFLTGNKEAIHHALFSLRQMCLGGIYDHIDGGFCRYSVDANWDVPHFEKMLYDHAQIIQALSIGYQYNKSPFLKRIIIQSMHFFETTMQDVCGLFYAAIDADSEGEEGNYYVWAEESVKEILAGDYKSFCALFTFSSLDHVHTDKKVIRLSNTSVGDEHLEKTLSTLDPALTKIRNVRMGRTLPSIDSKMIVSWNAMMVSAYASWYKASSDESYLDKAELLMENLLNCTCQNETEFCRYYINGKTSGFGFLEDYAYIIKALLDLFFHTQHFKYIEKAKQIFEYVHLEFQNPDSPLYNVSSSRYSDFEIQQLDWAESTYPNPNALLSYACSYFYEFTQDERYLKISKALINAVKFQALKQPLSLASWVQQILNAEWGPIILKTSENEFANKALKELHIPGLIRLSNDSASAELNFCFDGMCYKPVQGLEEVLSLFDKYKLRIENLD